jgi:uncharacterized protein DUF6940
VTGWRREIRPAGMHTEIVRIVDSEGAPLHYGPVFDLLRDDGAFRAFFATTFASARFDAFFWETPPVTSRTLERDFEVALVDAPPLARIAADPFAFAEHFSSSGTADVISFPNLGRDAVLVVPCPRVAPQTYAHLATFLRGAPESQLDAFFRALAIAVEGRVGPAPMWVSTAGLGVSWLHLRLDSRPKYYTHAPYRAPP